MWFTFFEAIVFGFVLLYLPGFLILKASRFSSLVSFISAPVVTICGIFILGILYAKISVPADWLSICLPLIIIGTLGLVIRFSSIRTRGIEAKKPTPISFRLLVKRFLESDWSCLFIYLIVACIFTLIFFVLPLDGPDSYGQDTDNTWHIPLIHSFVESKNISILDVTLYRDHLNDNFNLVNKDGSFYPAIWHSIAALIYSFIGISEPLCGNATTLVFLCFVYPCAIFLLIKTIFHDDRKKQFIGAIFIMAFAAFPWWPLLPITGPLYPFFVGMALLPILLVSFIQLIHHDSQRTERIRYGILFLASSLAVACSHTSVIFTAAVILFPYCVYRLYQAILSHNSKPHRLYAIVACTGFCVLFIVVWVVLYNSPALYATTHYAWSALTTKSQALIDIILVAYRRPFSQIFLAVLIVLGFLYTLQNKRYLWISFAYLFAALICFVCISSEGALKSLLGGFWYTDSYRVASTVAFVGILLATLGLYSLFRFICALFNLILNKERAKSYTYTLTVAILIGFVLSNFAPNYEIPGKQTVSTAFSDILYYMYDHNNSTRPNTFSPEESDFVEKVAEVVDPDSVIYNNADDGSPFGYSQENLNLAYRRSLSMMILDNDYINEEEGLLRQHINEIGTNEEVKKVASDNGIEYILILDMGGERLDERCFHGDYDPDNWTGINAINDSTPGLEIVLSEGDMRLYKIIG